MDEQVKLIVSNCVNLAYLKGINKSENPKLEEDAIAPIMALIAAYKTEVNRFEVIDHLNGGADGGRVLTRWEKQPFKVELSHQDDNRTLKIFLSDASSEPEGKPNE